MMDQWTERLSEYLDGELPPPERAALERHLGECLECRRTLAELREVVARAQTVEDREPATDLWTGIAARIGAQPAEIAGFKVIDLDAHRVSKAQRRFDFTLPQLAAASIALMMLSGSLVWFALGRSVSIEPVVGTVSNPDVRAVSTQSTPFTQYAEAVGSLEVALRQHRDRLDPVTIAILEENLRAIDSAITEASAALERDPSNLYLNQHLESTMKKKIQLLRRATALQGARI